MDFEKWSDKCRSREQRSRVEACPVVQAKIEYMKPNENNRVRSSLGFNSNAAIAENGIDSVPKAENFFSLDPES